MQLWKHSHRLSKISIWLKMRFTLEPQISLKSWCVGLVQGLICLWSTPFICNMVFTLPQCLEALEFDKEEFSNSYCDERMFVLKLTYRGYRLVSEIAVFSPEDHYSIHKCHTAHWEHTRLLSVHGEWLLLLNPHPKG